MNLRLVNLGLLTLTVLYPVGVYYGIQYIEPRYLILALALLFVLRFILNTNIKTNTQTQNKSQQVMLLGIISIFSVVVFISNSLMSLQFYPVLINAVMLTVFGYTLLNPPCMIERLARLGKQAFPDSAIPYTRNVTIIWCLFFIANGSMAAFTALYSSMEIWSLYNGFISYILMGSLFGGEYLVRCYVRKQHT